MKTTTALDRIVGFLGDRKGQPAEPIWIPALWNTCGYGPVLDEKGAEVLVHPYDFCGQMFEHIFSLSKRYPFKEQTCFRDSVIYSSLVRYTTTWDYDHDGQLESGTLFRLILLLPLLKKIGVNILYLLPVTRYSKLNLKGDTGSPYAIQTFFDLDPHLHDRLLDGMNEFTLDDEMAALVEACHRVDVKVVIDFIPRVTARNADFIAEHPDWVYWMKLEAFDGFCPPKIPELGFFEECTPDKLETVYKSKETPVFLAKFSQPPNVVNPELWEKLKQRSAQTGEELLTLVEREMKITTSPAHSDWINDVQPIWTDITFLRLYKDFAPQVRPFLKPDQAPYVLFDTIKCNYYPGEEPNHELWGVLEQAIRFNLERYGIDGFRVDIGHTVPVPLLAKLFQIVKETRPGSILISEDLFNRNHAKAAKTGYDIMLGSGWNIMTDISKENLTSYLKELPDLSIHVFACAETADTPRITSRGGVSLARMIGVFNNFLPNGIPYITTGFEVNEVQPLNCGLADNTNAADIPKAFFNTMKIDWTNSTRMISLLRRLNEFKRSRSSLIKPQNFFVRDVAGDVVAYGYREGGDALLALFNLNQQSEVTVDLSSLDLGCEPLTVALCSDYDDDRIGYSGPQVALKPLEALILSRTGKAKTAPLVIWHEFDGPGDTSKSVLEEICSAYSELQGVKITPEVMCIADLIERLQRVKKTGIGPQMAFVPSDMASLAGPALYSETPSDLFRKELSEDSLATMQLDGIQYGVPVLRGNHLVMFYNKDIFPEAPRSWEDLEAATDRLMQRSIVPIAADLRHPYWFIPFLTAFGGWPIRDSKPNLDTQEMLRALTFLQSSMKSNVIGSFDGSTDLLHNFFAGRIGAIICGEWIFNYVNQNMKEKLGVGRLPEIRGHRPIPMTSSVGLVFPNRALESEHRGHLLAFAEYMLSDECQKKWANQVHRIPASKSALNEVTSMANANKREVVAQMSDCRPIPVHAAMPRIWDAMKAGLDVLVNQQGEPEEALRCMVKEVGNGPSK